MSQKGEHTWELHLEYRACAACGLIFEDRIGYSYVLGHYEKEVTCPYCHKNSIVVKPTTPKFGPLFGVE